MRKPIIITTETFNNLKSTEQVIQECELIHNLVTKYGCRVHIRKKGVSEEQVKGYCMALLQLGTPREQITLHSFPEIVKSIRLGGYHDTIDNLKVWVNKFKHRPLLSTSCHNFQEADFADDMGVDYLFLSPIFDSISKSGYQSNHTLASVKQWLQSRERTAAIIALGGICESNIAEIESCGFSGAALLGAIWNEGDPYENYEQIINKIQ